MTAGDQAAPLVDAFRVIASGRAWRANRDNEQAQAELEAKMENARNGQA